MRKAFTLAATLLALALPLPARGADPGAVHDLSASRVEAKTIGIAIPPFDLAGGDPQKLGEAAARIVAFDLKFSGHFAPTTNMEFMRSAHERDRKRQAIDFAEWGTLTQNFLMKGSLEEAARGQMTMRVTVYNVKNGQQTYTNRYTGNVGKLREMAHLCADDLLKRIVNEDGVARTRIAFVGKSGGRKELFLMDYDGAGVRQVTQDKSLVLFPSLNPVYNQVLFTTYLHKNPDLYRLDLATGARYPISRKLGLNTTGDFSPDGKKVVFSLSYRGNSEIYVAGIDGSGLKKLTHDLSIETAPCWSPDGKYIAYTSDRPGVPQIYVMTANGENPRRLTFQGNWNDAPTWASTGDWIAFSSLQGGRYNIGMIDARQIGDDRRRDVIQLTGGTANSESPSFSPNGRHLTFMSNRSGTRQVYLMNLNGANVTQVTTLPGGGYTPAWGMPEADLRR
ncbi:MAG: Tol-Pal system beta propeller repeat protein TolB [Nitrospinae bacterium]|nr:Tol-Pal system beta propeller repeat protein TolB [Nitrospinota bacterium]